MASHDDTGSGLNTPRIICLTGPESSGKTTLATDLARAIGATLVEEAARTMLVPGAPYRAADVIEIAHLQAKLERQAFASTSGWIVLDTDLLVIKVWMLERFRYWPAQLDEAFRDAPARYYGLCVPDMPWQEDPLREHPDERERLLGEYRKHLADIGSPVIELTGPHADRLQALRSFALAG